MTVIVFYNTPDKSVKFLLICFNHCILSVFCCKNQLVENLGIGTHNFRYLLNPFRVLVTCIFIHPAFHSPGISYPRHFIPGYSRSILAGLGLFVVLFSPSFHTLGISYRVIHVQSLQDFNFCNPWPKPQRGLR